MKNLSLCLVLVLVFVACSLAGKTNSCKSSHFSGKAARCQSSSTTCSGVKVYNLCGQGQTCCVQTTSECKGSCKRTSRLVGDVCKVGTSRKYVSGKCPGGNNVMCCPSSSFATGVVETVTRHFNNIHKQAKDLFSVPTAVNYGECLAKTALKTQIRSWSGLCASYVKATLCRVLTRSRDVVWSGNSRTTKPINPGNKGTAYYKCNSHAALSGLAGKGYGRPFADWADSHPDELLADLGLVKYTGDPHDAPVGTVSVYNPGACGFSAKWGHLEIIVGENKACSDNCGQIRPRKSKKGEHCTPRQYKPADDSVADSAWCNSL